MTVSSEIKKGDLGEKSWQDLKWLEYYWGKEGVLDHPDDWVEDS